MLAKDFKGLDQMGSVVRMIVDKQPSDAFIDLFAGAGGVTEAIEQTKKAIVIACVNHDPVAITSHRINHPHALHYEEDIRTLDIRPLVHLVNLIRHLFPTIRIHLWASLECTNFSKAKGGLPRDRDSRTLAEDLLRYIDGLNPDKIWIENVVEFMAWGPLDKKGRPVSRKNGRDFIRWQKTVMARGYRYSQRILNAADFGAYTTRTRYFAQFATDNIEICWPEPTHCKQGSNDLYGGLKPWKAVKDVLDFSDKGKNIFDRRKPYSERTLERIYYGLVKFACNGDESFLSKYFSGRPQHKNITVKGPAGAIKTVDSHALVFLKKYNSNNPKTGTHKGVDINDPSPTICTQNRLALVQPMINHYYGNGYCQSVEVPSGALRTKDCQALVTPFIFRQFRSATYGDIDMPAGSVLGVPKMNVIQAEPWVMDGAYSNIGRSIDEPAKTVTADRRYQYLMNPAYRSKGRAIDDPCFTLVARMDKAPPYLIQAESGELAIKIFENDTEWTRRIKLLMAEYGIVAIYMRMLKISELKAIQGFPKGYHLEGTQADQKKQIGNAVEVHVVKAMIAANLSIKTKEVAK